MNSPKLVLAAIALMFVSLNVKAQDANIIKAAPVTIDQLLVNPINKYDTVSSTNACTTAPNNNYANAISLTVGAAAVSGHTCGSMQTNENKGCNTSATQSVWYTVTATAAVTYVIIDATGSSCYLGSAIWPSTGLPTSRCYMIDCQSAANGPVKTVYKIAGNIGNTYAIQVTYTTGGPCGQEGVFTIKADNSYGSTISNPGAINTCSAAYNGCYFTSTPTSAQVTSSCSAYTLTTQTNLVNNSFYKFTTAPINSNVLNFQDIISSTCGGGGNVAWFYYRLYDQYCNMISCGDLGNLQNNVACNQPYILEYMWEQLPCTYYQHYPFQYVPTGTIGCGTPLPIELITFEATAKTRKTQLKWATAKENNNDYFLIERSNNDLLYEPVVKVKSNGNSNSIAQYQYEDILPGDGRYYYRLKQVDINGDYNYSKIISVLSFNETSALSLKNPATENVEMIMENELAGLAQVNFINSQGAICGTEQWNLTKGMNKKTCSINNLKPGIYTVIVTSPFFTCHQKLVKV